MQHGQPSLTALWVATVRARHQLLDKPLVFEDPLALRILGETAASTLRWVPAAFEDLLSRTMRAPVAARSRIAEDALQAAVQRGVSQLVMLGAGLDTFAYRNSYPAERLRVFEVDHPATQDWKRSLLSQAGIAIPASLRFVPLDFETGALREALRAAGFAPDQPTFYSWLGVTMYLPRGAVIATLREIAESSSAGSEVVFDFIVQPPGIDLPRRLALATLAQLFRHLGEPWKTYFEPRELVRHVKSLGFSDVRLITQQQMNRMFFERRSDGLKIRSLGLAGMLLARV